MTDVAEVLIGYCFGGAAVLEDARMGLNVVGFVSFHGGLAAPEGQDYSRTKAPGLLFMVQSPQCLAWIVWHQILSKCKRHKKAQHKLGF